MVEKMTAGGVGGGVDESEVQKAHLTPPLDKSGTKSVSAGGGQDSGSVRHAAWVTRSHTPRENQ